jgi:AcrR family transcriptional regulator
MQPGFLRARRPDQKSQRRDSILAAARELAVQSGVSQVSLGSVATAVGLAKSNVLRYFATREEIYLQLTMVEGDRWMAALDERLQRASGMHEAVDALAETLAAEPLYCDLTTHMMTSLELNASVAALRTFKRWNLAMHGRVGAQLATAWPELDPREGSALVMAAAAYVARLYPLTRPTPALTELYAESPEIAAAFPPFLATLRHMLAATAAGLPLVRRPGAPTGDPPAR